MKRRKEQQKIGKEIWKSEMVGKSWSKEKKILVKWQENKMEIDEERKMTKKERNIIKEKKKRKKYKEIKQKKKEIQGKEKRKKVI